MLFRQHVLDEVRAGTVTLAFRRWTRPTVKAGGTLLTAVGQLRIGNVAVVAPEQISDADARRAGYESRQALIHDLDTREDGDVYRIELGALVEDPRVALREQASVSGEDLRLVLEKLGRMDARAVDGPWTSRTLTLIGAHPGRRAADLCRQMGQQKLPFKTNVRKLKALGLTESLEVGYRLSPRGAAVLAAITPEA